MKLGWGDSVALLSLHSWARVHVDLMTAALCSLVWDVPSPPPSEWTGEVCCSCHEASPPDPALLTLGRGAATWRQMAPMDGISCLPQDDMTGGPLPLYFRINTESEWFCSLSYHQLYFYINYAHLSDLEILDSILITSDAWILTFSAAFHYISF